MHLLLGACRINEGVREFQGNFKSRISLPMTGSWELLNGFNRMATQLENYDEANIEELKDKLTNSPLLLQWLMVQFC